MTTDNREALEALNYLEPGVSRKDWLLIAIAAKAAGISFEDFNQWSSRADNYGGINDTRTAWKDVAPKGDMGGNRIFHMAREAGWRPLRTDSSPAPFASAPQRSRPRQPPIPGVPTRAKAVRKAASRRAGDDDHKTAEEKQKEAENRKRATAWMARILATAKSAAADHPYLQRKKVRPSGLLEIPLAELVAILGFTPETSKRGHLAGDSILVCPFHAGDGKPATLEFIDGEGRKCALYGLPRRGMMWGTLPPDPPLIGIAEGVATAKTVATAAVCPTVASGSVNNIENTLIELRRLYPQSEFIIFADLGKAKADAQSIADQYFYPCIAPDPKQVGENGSDFNDMELAAGFDAVSIWIAEHRFPRNEISWLNARTPVEIDYVLPSMPAGSVGLIAGPGAVGKTYFALDLCVSIALGRSLSQLPAGFRSPKSGRAAIVLGEDPPDIIHNRLCAMSDAHQISEDDRQRLGHRMKLLSMAGEDMRMIAMEGNTVTEGPFTRRLEALCYGRRLVILDPLIRLHDGPENDNNVANKLMLHIQRIARDTNCAILLLHHVGKGSGDNWQAARGASAYTTSVRWQMNMLPPSDDEIAKYGLDKAGFDPRGFVRCAGVKMNYGTYVDEFWLGRVGGGVLMHRDMEDMSAEENDGNPFDGAQLRKPFAPPSGGQALGVKFHSPRRSYHDGLDDDDIP